MHPDGRERSNGGNGGADGEIRQWMGGWQAGLGDRVGDELAQSQFAGGAELLACDFAV